jgi:hypothetical protein
MRPAIASMFFNLHLRVSRESAAMWWHCGWGRRAAGSEAAVKLRPQAATMRPPAFTVFPPNETFGTLKWLPEREKAISETDPMWSHFRTDLLHLWELKGE